MLAIRSKVRPGRGPISIPTGDDATLKSYSDRPPNTYDDDSWAPAGTSTAKAIRDHREFRNTFSSIRAKRSDEDRKPEDERWRQLETFDSSAMTMGTRKVAFEDKILTLEKTEDGTYMTVEKLLFPAGLTEKEWAEELMTCNRTLRSSRTQSQSTTTSIVTRRQGHSPKKIIQRGMWN
jgi:hypothetical protein